MLKKIDKAQLFLEDHLHLFQCPVCSQAFESVENHQVFCRGGHQFDLSKKGTLFLLQKSVPSEYSRDMLLARQRLAESGLWTTLLDKIQSLIKHPEGVLLDIGCGEGSHSAYLKKKGHNGPIIGFDISKEGINLAAASHEDIFFLTADLARSPFASLQYDTLLNILSPSNYSEFDRLLKKDGQVIKVVPNPGYLKELRSLQKESKQSYSNAQVVEKFEEHYSTVRKVSVKYTFHLPDELVEDFVHMTPLGWHIKEDFDNIRTKLKEITVDLLILIGESEDSA
ncbi:methyltransferase domain-containing protein [Alkalibacterium pelagium]|uniref:23S rRNA (Guanine745-N1)-methyltransferase n=1 Tax=Alkalibacterium pelagium TaxID=426702 RepID=A0A1H7KWR5_9LACT|nr:methyltransferase domain-containing protein [Alkalibacterium pelagium]GEN50670.1 50S rRNA methyltransferase [Alkalibacterium pelagium]SEK90994.1 23S rRNA (guanine745-N1)-methyltransferase [Alkalibacterium pelagium]